MSDLANLVPRGGLIIAETDRTNADRYAGVRRAAIALAAQTGADVLFFERSAASLVTDPFPSGPFTAEVDGPHGERPLVAAELGALGRSYLRDQLEDAERQGVLGLAWLPRRRGATGLADAVDHTGAHLVLLSSAIENPSLVQRLTGHGLDHYLRRVDAPIALVEPGGDVRLVSPDPGIELRPSRIAFMAGLAFQRVRGTFRRFAVRIQLDPEHPAGGSVQARIQADSLTTGLAARDLHLRSGQFLDAGRNPVLTFRSTMIERTGDVLAITGELELHGRTQPVSLWGTVHELGSTADGRRRVRVRASTELHWRKWGVHGLPFIGDVLTVTLDIEALETTAGGGHFHARGVDAARVRRRAAREPRVVAHPA